MAIKVLLVDDHAIMREGVRALLDGQPDLQIIGEAATGWEAVRTSGRLSPQVIIMDVAMPDLNGIEATRRILGDNPRIKVIGLSMHISRNFVIRMIEAGASGYLSKGTTVAELVRAIKTVVKNQIFLPPGISDILVEEYLRQSNRTADKAIPQLTNREKEILQLLAEGRSVREIAEKLYISQTTVHVHRRNILQKIGVSSTAQLVKYAVREGLTSLDA